MLDGATSITIKSNGGDTPRAWSTIKYTVSVNVPTDFGAYTIDVPNVQSKNKKSDTLADVVPAPVGSEHPATIRANILTCDIAEEWNMAECTSSPSSNKSDRIRLLVREGLVSASPTVASGEAHAGGEANAGGISSGGRA